MELKSASVQNFTRNISHDHPLLVGTPVGATADGTQHSRYIISVWKIGILLQGEVERGTVERAVKRLIVDEEGACMRKRALGLREKLKASVRGGGSSYNALDELVKHLKTE
ncbi:hypothetical protein ISN44_As10g014600 [Arabidopsis suecica]|uniref:Uncharacterized protein n=1 Tax=Arabidopsis suecica TaxID=45249 RepID=A0A8T1ZV37_ARASU|nr:hypothetical protein ISN44_As10g014600 [Arabidopsis suecica]